MQHRISAADPSPVHIDTAPRDVRPFAAPISDRASRWWTVHQPIADAWVRTVVHARGLSLTLAQRAAHAVLSVPERRSSVHPDPVRRPFTWSGIDAHEILFRHGHPRLREPSLELLVLMGEFAAHLGALGLIAPLEDWQLQRTWPLWCAQYLAAYESA